MATLGEWHHRPGGRWIVDRSCQRDWRYRFTWIASADGGRGWASEYAPFAFLARRRAIAALQMMREQDKGGQ